MRYFSKIRVGTICSIVVAIILIISGEAPGVEDADKVKTYEEAEAKIKENAFITHISVGAPIGRFILIRKNRDACAVRFTEYHRGHDAKPATIFRSRDESFYAQYDWFYQGDGSGDLTKKNVKSGHRKLDKKPLVGIGRLAFQLGDDDIKCGPFKFYWLNPVSITFMDGSMNGQDSEVEFSPTKWVNITEVNIKDEHLKWYRYDENRKRIYISLDEL